MSNHSFNPFIAKKFGLVEAILIDNFIFWTRTNAAKPENENNFFEGRYWFFGTPAYFSKFFPYLSARQIKYALSNLYNSGALLKGNFNKKGYDKTNWYSLSDSILSELNLDKCCLQPAPVLIEQNCPIHRTNLVNASDKIVQPIPSTKPSTKQDITTTTGNEVVVVDINSKSLTEKEKTKLTEEFTKKPMESPNIKSLENFLSAALFSILNREEHITRSQRLHGIIKLVRGGSFEEPALWVKEQKKIDYSKETDEERRTRQIKAWEEEKKRKSDS